MGSSQTQRLLEMFITNCKSTSFKGWVCSLFLCHGGRSNMDLRSKQACEIYVTFAMKDLNPGQRPSDMRQGYSKPIQQYKLKTLGCYFCVQGLTILPSLMP